MFLRFCIPVTDCSSQTLPLQIFRNISKTSNVLRFNFLRNNSFERNMVLQRGILKHFNLRNVSAGNVSFLGVVFQLWIILPAWKLPLRIYYITFCVKFSQICLQYISIYIRFNQSSRSKNLRYILSLKTVDTIGNCPRLVFSLGVSQHMFRITNQ